MTEFVTGMVALAAMLVGMSGPVTAEEEPWVITEPVVLTEPADLGHVIVIGGGSLTVLDLPEPGLHMSGHIWAVGDARVRLENSVIQFLSEYHGQYSLVGAEDAQIEVIGCDYRVPNGVQHALMVAGSAEMTVEDTDFGDVHLLSAHTATLDAKRLTGNFEVLVQDDSTMVLADIPRVTGAGKIWVWVEFPAGSEAEYSPPMPGYTESWSFPPPGATGIHQTATIDRCETLLWPMLVRAESRVTLRDIPDEHWIVVGFHMPNDGVVEGLVNDLMYADQTLDPDVAAGRWRLDASARDGGDPVLIAEGTENAEDDVLGIWSDANPMVDHRRQTVLTDGLGHTLFGNIVVPGISPRVR